MAELDPALMTIAEASAAIGSGNLKPSSLVDACLERMRVHEADVCAWACSGGDLSRMTARLLDAGNPDGSLYGIPFGVKDIIDTADLATEFGTPIYHGHRPARDAACVALLKAAGGICLGKTVTTELAHFHPGRTRNPHAPGHTPGGSSSGSAAAVAACMVPVALGTQTTGSVLRPASYCGVYGFKPSFGDVSRSGVFECATSLDTVGWFTRSVADIETVRRALIGAPAAPLASVSLSALRIGLLRGPAWQQVEPHTQNLIESAARQLSSAGARVDEVTPPNGFDRIAAHHRVIAGYEFARAISWERTQRQHLLSPKLLDGRCADGLRCSYDEYAEAQAELVTQRAAISTLMQEHDLLITAAAPGEAWEGLSATGDPVCNTAWTALHMPALSIPAFTGPRGLPVGLQLIGAFRQDHQLLSAAAAVATELGLSAPLRAPA